MTSIYDQILPIQNEKSKITVIFPKVILYQPYLLDF